VIQFKRPHQPLTFAHKNLSDNSESSMFTKGSVLCLALLLAVAQACPYLAREQEKQSGMELPNQNIRRAQVVTSKPTGLDEAIQMATTMIKQIIVDNKGMGAKFVRLSFHDCVGGCDGCVDLSNPSNFGLQTPIDILVPVVQHNGQFLTIGDIWALAGLVASRVSQKDTTVSFALQFVGRPQCAGADTTGGPHRVLPSAHFSTKKVVDFFAKTFNFSPDETVAILGAHTL
jgi:Peroxidase